MINSATTAGGKIGKSFSYHMKATNQPTSFGATGLPGGLSVATSTGIVAASGIVMQGLLTIQAMTEETGNPSGGGAGRS